MRLNVKNIFQIMMVVIVILLSGCGYNTMQSQEETVSEAWANLQSQLQRRADLLPNLVQTVKGYAAHEKEVFTAVANARAKLGSIQVNTSMLSNPAQFKQFQGAQGEISSALSRLLVVVEKYPELKANEEFLKLQDEIAGTENRINVARIRYNGAVKEFNYSIRSMANSITNKLLLHLEKKGYYQAETDAKPAPKIDFSK